MVYPKENKEFKYPETHLGCKRSFVYYVSRLAIVYNCYSNT